MWWRLWGIVGKMAEGLGFSGGFGEGVFGGFGGGG